MRVFEAVCPPLQYMSQITVEPQHYALSCETVGHYSDVVLRRYATRPDAEMAFNTAAGSHESYPFHDLPAVYWEMPFPELGGAHRNLVWRLGCWVISAHSFDDTIYRLAPQVLPVSERLYADIGDVLLDQCAAEPTSTLINTTTPSPTPSSTRAPLFAAVAAPFEARCNPFGIIGAENAYETATGFHLFCRPTAGHEHVTNLTRYDSTATATRAFEAAATRLPPIALDGVLAAYDERPFQTGPGCAGDCGLLRELVWQLDCWVAAMRSSDDTNFIGSLDPLSLSREMLASAADKLRAACD